jgi:hypothetical protein
MDFFDSETDFRQRLKPLVESILNKKKFQKMYAKKDLVGLYKLSILERWLILKEKKNTNRIRVIDS